MLTPWHDAGLIPSAVHVPWRVVYQPPTSKKEGDVQYKLLHNVLPSLPVLHHLNGDIPRECGWCGERGDILHLFIKCPSIQSALTLLHTFLGRLLPDIRLDFDLYWTLIPHARGRRREAVRLGNYLIISLKSTFYWLYRTCKFTDPLLVWKHRIKNKVVLEYHYYVLTNSISLFLDKWSFNNVLFTYSNNKITWCF